MIHYIIQVIAFQVFFLLIYDVFLKRETFFNWNRAYLLMTALLSVLLPFIKIEGFKNAVSPDFIVSLPQVLSQTPNTIFLEEVVINGSNSSHSILWYTTLILLIGSALAFVFFTVRLFQIFKLSFQNSKQKQGSIYYVSILKSTVAFSFFNYIFLGENIQETERAQIIKHEIVHVNQKHSWDLLFFELLRIAIWFNPLVYMYQNRMTELHEFIADSKAVKNNKKQYYENLLAQIFDANHVSFINPFFKQSLIKKRIIMLQKSKSKQVQLIKYALLIPMVSAMLLYSSCSADATQTEVVEQELTIENQIEALKNSIEANGELSEINKEALRTLLMQSANKKVVEGSELHADGTFQEVPFAVVDQVPVFPGCESGSSNEVNKQCMSKKLNAFVAENFNTELATTLNLTGIQQIRVFFKISETGKIVDIKARAPKPELEAEAKRVLNMLPDLIPGKNKGQKVRVAYYLPIKFQVNE
ncbi:M56 family metallopeptidase [Bizionia myxarmorum]|uniref:BlaR1 peptidase M56 family protein n=1 Tax=Bizionia myxarmorum TaxID=291186 RepID=A0A5D0RBP3_9FLAO|nr:M56 family metallopeptidase [Bizionia myxarmorum]TYB79080.1 blaR1 peptidase M56 family protein [Bizionia myxarmorum]